ncbi:MAG TPA: hypothetical protein VFW50_40795 [Streptosporangiaceae bacterium]|nr:hypothetical protein [Streptosporangiaceae bacterium]
MRVRDHVLISTAGAALAAPFIGRRALGLWAGSVLIDTDHYAWFCVRQRRVSPRAAGRFFNGADVPAHPATRALHAPAVLSLVLLLGLRDSRLLPVGLGMGLHVALDTWHAAQLTRARSAALERDEHTCRACGAPSACAHVWRQPTLLPSYQVQNLISLCRACHETAHARPKEPALWT